MTLRRPVAAALSLAAVLMAGCASSSKDPFLGAKSLDATVVERQYDPPGSGGASYAGTGNYYLVFEGREGDATARYRFPVTRQQYIRFQEGAHVQLVIIDGNLRDIRPLR
jgi:hypothetical protein